MQAPSGSVQHGWLEYWLNRYQTLIGALAALAAAWYAGRWVSRQITLAQKQLDAAMGDLPPDFALEPAGYEGSPGELQIEDLILRVNNQNRRPLQITGVSLRSPRGPLAEPWSSDFASDLKKELKLVGRLLLTDGRLVPLTTRETFSWVITPSSLVIDGTRPAASTVNGARIRLRILGKPTEGWWRMNTVFVEVEVDYIILGARLEYHSATVITECHITDKNYVL